MLDVTASNLLTEVEAARKNTKAITDESKERRRRTLGPNYRTDLAPMADEHENHGIEFCTNFIPQLAFYNPQFDYSSDILDADDPQVQAMRDGTNCLSIKQQWGRLFQRLAWDVCHDFGVSVVTMEAVPGYGNDPDADEIPLYPMLKRMSPPRFFADSQAIEIGECRLMGHLWIRDKSVLLTARNPDGTPAFDPEVINAAADDAGVDEIRKELNETRGSQDHARRKQIVGYEIYVPETGMIYTILRTPNQSQSGNNAGYARAPRRYSGPRRGPYTIWGVTPVTEQLFPLAPLATTEGLVSEINAHAGQASDDAGAAKRQIITGSKTIAEGIKSHANGTIWQLPGFDPSQYAEISVGGAQPANLEYTAGLRERLDRRSGLSQTIRGNITGATATEVNEAQSSADKRTRLAQRNFQDCVVEAVSIVAQLMHDSPEVRFPISVKDPITGRKIPKIFIGGPQPGMPFLPFDSMNIKIKPYSDSYVDEAVLQKRAQDTTTLVLEAAPAMPQLPWVKFRPLIDDLFATMNVEGGGERYIDFNMLGQQQMAMQQQQAMAQQQAQGGGGPGGPPASGAGGGAPTGNDQGTAQGDPTVQEQTGMGAAPGIAEHAAMLAEAATA